VHSLSPICPGCKKQVESWREAVYAWEIAEERTGGALVIKRGAWFHRDHWALADTAAWREASPAEAALAAQQRARVEEQSA
jgi:hypothetical protein